MRWFLRELFASFNRIRKKDPIVFWCFVITMVANTLNILLAVLWNT